MTSPTLSVVLPVHSGVALMHFRQALESVLVQTRGADEIVIVEDGPLDHGHRDVLRWLEACHPGVVRVRLATNQGAGAAIQAGLERAHGTWIARVDSDDINEPQRFQRQLDILTQSGADVCSSSMTEFEDHPARVIGVRVSPIAHADFAHRMKGLNPVNHPTVIFRRSTAIGVGGYDSLPKLEDYDLWARMLCGGAQFIGVDEPLVRFRTDGMLDRRTGRSLDASEREMQHRLLAYGIIGVARMRYNLIARGLYRRLPRPLLKFAYEQLFR